MGGCIQQGFKIKTNMSKDECIMDLTLSDQLLHNLSPLAYASGNVEKMAQFVAASCAIPGIVPHRNIDGENYVDGGVVCASPLSYFKRSLIRYAMEKKMHFHFTCSTCEDQDAREGGCYKSSQDGDTGSHLIQGLMDIVSSMVSVSLVRDRATCHDILVSLGSTLLGTITFKADYESLQEEC